MNDILQDLRDADRKGVCPPQNWTTRAINEIERLKKVIERLEALGNGWRDLKSSNIKRARYIANDNALEVEFHNGGHYGFQEVPEEVFNELCEANFPGKFFHSEIRSKFEGVNLKKKEINDHEK